MPYSRENPSDMYKYLMRLYTEMHKTDQDAQNSELPVFYGLSLGAHIENIRQLALRNNSKSMLDYGCGKALYYQHRNFQLASKPGMVIENLVKYWQLEEVALYEPAYAPFNHLPEHKFDAVISTDVLEHCPKDDMEWIIEDLFSHATQFVYASISCLPATKYLPDGQNAHITIEPRSWWEEIILNVASKYPDVDFYFVFIDRDHNSPDGKAKSSMFNRKMAYSEKP
ncbi:MAG: class I SAM-dependent methyltransferase [Gammaproteobacteria bacterium]|nr:class I SAM-dependent methyltransferase [Gammaproteobacteria bacterium]MDH5692741.1 class I SAM-dependent methyltransferase [Gammaproteobacteria bacterium]